MRNKRVCDYIAEAIQNEILSGRMSSGAPLRQEELADSLGYSRIPIREALQILESQGLAKRLATRHVVVADFSDEVITEIYELLADVEIKLLKGMLQSGICLWEKAVSDNNEQLNCAHETSAINENISQASPVIVEKPIDYFSISKQISAYLQAKGDLRRQKEQCERQAATLKEQHSALQNYAKEILTLRKDNNIENFSIENIII